MNRKALLKISLLSVSIAIILSVISLLFLNRFTNMQGSRFRDDFLRFFVSSLERRVQGLSLEEIRTTGSTLLREDRFGPPFGPPPPMPPPPPHGGPMMGPPPGGPGGPRGPGDPGGRGPQMWLVTKAGEILASRETQKESFKWNELSRSEVPGVVVSHDDFFRLSTSISVIKLNSNADLYLVLRDSKPPFLGTLLVTQAVLTSSMIVIAMIVAFAGLFFYLRRKSAEARSVLRRLEEGDLKARFEIKRFDEFGALMLDFNRMAEEIETLVGRIHATESKRKKLLQELGHDLRTPLTSLKSNFEILENHHERLSLTEKTSIFASLSGEIDYFKDLIEKLITIASLDEPHYKASTEQVDLEELLKNEVSARQKSSENKLSWNFTSSTTPAVLGDSHLLLRLLKNGLDNAARYAQSSVSVDLSPGVRELTIIITDDGPGLDLETQKNFGERSEFRGRKVTKDGHFSLGLGSVIMKAVTELHNGKINISNVVLDGKTVGAKLEIKLPTVS